ncbi:MAG: PBP1A family penicillin-binding protein [bacterium]
MPIPQLSNKTRSPQNWRRRHPGHKHKTSSSWSTSKFRSVSRPKIKISKQGLSELFSKRHIIKYGSLGLLAIIVIGFIYTLIISRSLPDPNKLMEREVAESTKIYDRTGETILYEVHGSEKRTLVNLNDIPDYVKNATIAVEDKDFYKHHGFSMWAIFRTAVTNVLFGRKAGASTLTQQFIKNAVLTSEKKYSRKIKELILAYRLEQKFNKDEILQMYLNEIPYGSSAYGVEAAAQYYFGKTVKDINLAEAAVLAALPQAPTYYSPYGQHRQDLLERQQYVLDLMVKQNYINQGEADIAKNTEITFKERTDDILAPHFVMHIREMLAEEYGEKAIEQGGYKIISTLDADKQEIAQKVLSEIATKNAESYNATNAALVSIDPKNGQILAMVGSRDFFNEDIDGQVNVVTRPRQPGSSFKPVVYTAAWQKGYLPETMLYDVVTNFSDSSTPYEPHNYTGQEYGPVSFRQALQGSLNIAAVKVLYLAGVKNVLQLAENMGYSTLSPKDTDRLGLSLVLGGGEVTLLDHTNAFSAFAREGVMNDPVFILKVADNKGEVLQEWKEKPGRRVLDTNIARMTNNVLSDNGARAYIFGANNYLTLPGRPVATKTGTTNDFRDAWTIGYTPSLVTGVWAGNNDNTPMAAGADSSKIAAPIWNAYMQQALSNTPVESFTPPEYDPNTRPILKGEGFAKKVVKIDKASGLLATEYTPASFTIAKTYVQDHCLLYYVDKDQPQNYYPKNTEDDPQFARWEAAVKQWVAKRQAENPDFVVEQPPIEFDNVHIPENLPTFLVSLKNNQLVSGNYLEMNLEAKAPRGVRKGEYYINDDLFDVVAAFPYTMTRPLNQLPNGIYKLTISICDDIDNCSRQDFNINLQIPNNNAQQKITMSWASPADGLNVTSKNFPLPIKVNIINPSAVAELRFYYSADGQAQLIGSKQNIKNTIEEYLWQPPNALVPNVYTLYVEADNWQGQTTSTNKIQIKVNKE